MVKPHLLKMQWESALLELSLKTATKWTCITTPPRESFLRTAWLPATLQMSKCQTSIVISTTTKKTIKSASRLVSTLRWTCISEPPSLSKRIYTWTSTRWRFNSNTTSHGTLTTNLCRDMRAVMTKATSKMSPQSWSLRPSRPITSTECAE